MDVKIVLTSLMSRVALQGTSKLLHTTEAPAVMTSLPVMATVGVWIQARGAMVVETVLTTQMKRVALQEETQIPLTMWVVPIAVPTSLHATTTGGVWTKLAVATAVSTARIVPMRSIVLPCQIKLPDRKSVV